MTLQTSSFSHPRNGIASHGKGLGRPNKTVLALRLSITDTHFDLIEERSFVGTMLFFGTSKINSFIFRFFKSVSTELQGLPDIKKVMLPQLYQRKRALGWENIICLKGHFTQIDREVYKESTTLEKRSRVSL